MFNKSISHQRSKSTHKLAHSGIDLKDRSPRNKANTIFYENEHISKNVIDENSDFKSQKKTSL